jgi:hypothetical protein
MQKKIDWQNLKRANSFYPILGVVDCTEFKFQTGEKWLYLGHKKYPTLKYLLVINAESDYIGYAYGPIKGRISDITLLRETALKKLKPNEYLIGDPGMAGEYQLITPYKANQNRDQGEKPLHNWICHALSARIEQINQKFKVWFCLKNPWRHDSALHQKVFTIILNLIQSNLKEHPLRRKK